MESESFLDASEKELVLWEGKKRIGVVAREESIYGRGITRAGGRGSRLRGCVWYLGRVNLLLGFGKWTGGRGEEVVDNRVR